MRNDQNVDDKEPHQQQAGQNRAEKQIPHRNPDDIANEHQYDTRRNNLAQRARGRHRPGGQGFTIIAAQHRRHRQQAHRHHRGANNAGGGAKQRPHDHHGNRQATAQAAKQQPHRIQQFFRQARALQHHPHEHKQRHRH